MKTTTTPMSNDEIVENLKTMVFGVQAYKRFNAKERETLDKAWNLIDQYENRLKADKVAMLEELKKEIIELPFPQREPEYMQGYSYCQMNILDYVIQQKINTLKGEENVDTDTKQTKTN